MVTLNLIQSEGTSNTVTQFSREGEDEEWQQEAVGGKHPYANNAIGVAFAKPADAVVMLRTFNSDELKNEFKKRTVAPDLKYLQEALEKNPKPTAYLVDAKSPTVAVANTAKETFNLRAEGEINTTDPEAAFQATSGDIIPVIARATRDTSPAETVVDWLAAAIKVNPETQEEAA